MTAPARLCLGTVQFGMVYGIAGLADGVPPGEAHAILEAASAAGITRLDTAPGYGDIEERLANLCRGLDFAIITKIPALPQGADPAAFVTASLDTSRQRLGERLAGVLFHGPADLAGPQGEALWRAASAWCARAGLPLGTSAYGPDEVQALAARFPLAACQIPGNALDQRLRGLPGGLPGVEITLRSVFLQGLLLMDPAHASRRLPAAAAALARWHGWCAQQGLAPLDAALGLAKGLPGVAFCAVGVDSVAQFEAIANAWDTAAALQAPELATIDPQIIDPRVWQKGK